MKPLPTGKRLEIVVLQIKRNKYSGLTELYQLQEYFKIKKNENYEVVGFTYGSPKNSLVKLCKLYLDNNLLHNPLKTLYEITLVFIETKKVSSAEVTSMGLLTDFEKLGESILSLFRAKKKEGQLVRESTVSTTP